MFSNIAKGLGCVVIGGILSMVAITWTDENTAEEILAKLREANDRLPADTTSDQRKVELNDLAEQLLAEADEKILMTATLRELRTEIRKFLNKL